MSKRAPRRGRKPKAGPPPIDLSVDAALLHVDQEPAEYEYRIQGASGFEGGKDLKRGDKVNVTVGARVIGEALVLRKRHEAGVGSEAETLVRIVTLKATGAFIR